MKWAIINNDIVENIIEYDGKSAYRPIEDLILCKVNDWINIGDHKDTPNLQKKP